MKIFGRYFNIKILIKPFFAALLLALPIYLHHFGFAFWFLDLLSFALALYLFLGLSSKEAFFGGFFTGILWFYWIALSFRYYDLVWAIPLVLLGIGLIYGAIFWIGYKIASLTSKELFAKALFWLFVGYIHPFGFNWFIPQMILAQTPIFPDIYHYGLLLLATASLHLKGKMKLLALSSLLLFYPTPVKNPQASLSIKLVTTHIPQDQKWLPQNQNKIIEQNFRSIRQAIDEGYDLVVLPESAFPLFLNHHGALLSKLQDLSHKISIFTGALYQADNRYYNSSYLFVDGKVQIFNKVVLVPFGEEIPLPRPIARWINQHFFGGSSDFSAAKKPYTFTIKGAHFTNAICYEATHPLIYSTKTPYIIAISNNAWFIPSIEPTLQWMLLRYYATIFHKTIYHATNIAKTSIIR